MSVWASAVNVPRRSTPPPMLPPPLAWLRLTRPPARVSESLVPTNRPPPRPGPPRARLSDTVVSLTAAAPGPVEVERAVGDGGATPEVVGQSAADAGADEGDVGRGAGAVVVAAQGAVVVERAAAEVDPAGGGTEDAAAEAGAGEEVGG